MIYLLHFSRGYRTRRGRVLRHYMGTTRNLRARMDDHKAGRGAKLLASAVKRGIELRVARTWKRGSFATEKKLKGCKNLRSLCPVCSPDSKK